MRTATASRPAAARSALARYRGTLAAPILVVAALVAPGMLAVSLLAATSALAGVASTSTTTTLFDGTTTTTMFVPTDITGGGDFEGSFPAGSFDSYSFELAEARVLVAETTNGFGGCPGDTLVELRQLGGPGNCNGMYGDDLPCIAFDDDSGLAVCSRLVKHMTTPGAYELRVTTASRKALPRYFLHVDFVEIECGNGEVELTETCDDGNTEAGDCCSPTCQKTEVGSPCDDGRACNGGDSCDALGICSQHEDVSLCPGSDGDGDCAETCDDLAEGCTSPDPDGVPCDDGIFCNGPDFCLDGSCSVHLGDPCPGTDGDLDCSEMCDEESDSCTLADPDDAPCNDGRYCTGADHCVGGECDGHAGNPCTGADGDGNCAESCSEPLDSCAGPDPNGSACDDGLFCNGTDKCSLGSCSSHKNAPCAGPDGDDNCSESCNEALDTCSAADADGAPCNDGVFCNGADTCQGGTCSGHAGNPCAGADGDGNCSETCNEAADNCTGPDPNGSACDDGLFCTGADTCQGGACSGHAGDPCPGADGDFQCSESCDEAADHCNAADPNGSACEDGLVCTGADTCQGGTCSGHAMNPCPGPDGDADCSESCDDEVGGCDGNDPGGSPCDDGDPCTAATCDGGGACVGGTPLECDDGNACTVDSCVEDGSSCSNLPIPDCTTTTTVTTITTTTTTTTLPGAVCGDQGGDGLVKASDALAILKAAVGGTFCDAEPCVCDANGSGTVTAADALLALKLAVGADVTVACPC